MCTSVRCTRTHSEEEQEEGRRRREEEEEGEAEVVEEEEEAEEGRRRMTTTRRRRIARPCLGSIFPNHQELAVPLLPVPLQRLARRLDVVAQAGIESKVRSGLIVF